MICNISNLTKLVIIVLGVVWQCIILSHHPLYLNKYRFTGKEKAWKDIYEYNDSLFFQCGQSIDTIAIFYKCYYNPRNEFGFDWEDKDIVSIIEIGHEISPILMYNFWTKHNGEHKEWWVSIKKDDNGIYINSTFGGIDAKGIRYDMNKQDSVIIYSSDFNYVYNNDNIIEGLSNYKMTPTEGLVEYSLNDGKVYKLIEHRRADNRHIVFLK